MASSHFGSSTKRSSRVSKSFQLVKPKLYSSTSMFGGRGHQSHKRRAGSYPGGFSLLLSPFGGPFSIEQDRKSTRLNSSHRCISYAVFCLKKKKQHRPTVTDRTRWRQRKKKPEKKRCSGLEDHARRAV